MHPILRVFGRELGAYPVLVVAALATSAVLYVAWAPRFAIPRRHAAWLTLAALFCGVAGAKLGSVALEGASPFSLRGFTYLGGLVGGAAALVAAARITRLKVPPVLDLAALAAAWGLALGRIGCLLAGCCWGKPTLFPIALVFRDFSAPVRPIGVPLHATQIYESAGALLLFGALALWKMRRPPAQGMIALSFIVAYGLLRFGLEFLRADPRGASLAGLSPPQLTSLVMVVGGVIGLARLRGLISARAVATPTAARPPSRT